jgi:hypothetical protein
MRVMLQMRFSPQLATAAAAGRGRARPGAGPAPRLSSRLRVRVCPGPDSNPAPAGALGRQTPLVAFNARLKARPTLPEAPTHSRVSP